MSVSMIRADTSSSRAPKKVHKLTNVVVVGQERMAYNFVYTFKSKDMKNPWVSEIRSMPKGVASLPSVFKTLIKMDKGVPLILCKVKYVERVLVETISGSRNWSCVQGTGHHQ